MPSEAALTRRIRAIKTRLAALPDLRPGSLSEQYTVCGTPNCRCKADPPHKHGPYYHLSYTRGGRGHTETVRPEDLPTVQTQLRAYQQLRTLIDHWLDASIALDRLRRTRTR